VDGGVEEGLLNKFIVREKKVAKDDLFDELDDNALGELRGMVQLLQASQQRTGQDGKPDERATAAQ
jgi:hypothetical protein